LPRIDLHEVILEYPVYEIDSRSLRHAMLSATTGGRLRSNEQRITVIRALDGLNPLSDRASAWVCTGTTAPARRPFFA
jgi:hypothetical protein